MTTTSAAPVCPISRDQAVPGMPGRQLPVPPRALDLPSLIRAVNALRDLIMAGFNNRSANNTGLSDSYGFKPNGSFNQDAGKPLVVVKQDWREVVREDSRVRIFHGGKIIDYGAPQSDKTSPEQSAPPTGHSKNIYVDVIRIHKLMFHYVYNNFRTFPDDEFWWEYKKTRGQEIDQIIKGRGGSGQELEGN